MAQVPQHPANVAPQQQGLGAPVAQSNPNQYFVPNQALQSSNGRLEAAQVQQAQAQAQKAMAEAVLQAAGRGVQGLGNPVQAQPQVSPQEVQAGQLAEGLLGGQIGQEQLQGMIQAGQLDPAVANAAIGMAQSYMQRDQAQAEQAVGGLGSF
jgi:hypothetical protein